MRRYQVEFAANVRSPLFGRTRRARRQLRKALPRKPLRWRRNDGAWKDEPGRWRAAAHIVADAETRKGRNSYETDKKVTLWLLVGEPSTLSKPPPEAYKTNGKAINRTLAFHDEITLVFPDYKTLGAYLPRPIKSDIPPGWTIGKPWPPGAYASEHAWGNADDVGMKDDKNPGQYELDRARLVPFLNQVHNYILANYLRLSLVEHIYNRRKYVATTNPEIPYMALAYTGSDPHDTHTHDQFADHDGRKPPWL